MGLVERVEHLATVVDRFAHVGQEGHLVLLSGEAGAGKSALVEELLANHLDGAPALVGRCDDLFTPRPLGPLADIALARPGPLAAALADGEQATAFDAFLAELRSHDEPVVVVLEDLQWADEATLDLLRFVARRLESLPCLVLATYRDGLPADHPLRRASGSLVGPRVTRIHLPPLSLDAVRVLVGDRPIDPVSLHARTGGNPFFLVEALEADPGALPATVRDVILARAAALSGAARDALDAAAVLGRHVRPELIETVGDCDATAIDECVATGLLVDDGGRQAFRHDLARQAVEDAMTPLRRRQLHARALAALGDDDVVQRAHHAVGAGDAAAIVELAARAADHCVSLGAHTQAAVLYGRALEHQDRLEPEKRRRLLEARARTCMQVERIEEAVVAGEEALAAIAATADEAALGGWECWLSSVYRAASRPADAEAALERGVRRLEPLGDSPALAQGLAQLAGHHMVHGRHEQAITAGRRARALAERHGLERSAVYAMNMYGSAMAWAGDPAGIDVLRESIDRAKRAALPSDVSLAAANLGGMYLSAVEPTRALGVVEEGLAVAEEHEMRYRRNCMLGTRADVLTLLGRWDEAVEDVATVLAQPDIADGNRCGVL